MYNKKEKPASTNINCEKTIYWNFQKKHWKYWFFDIEIFTCFYKFRKKWKNSKFTMSRICGGVYMNKEVLKKNNRRKFQK